MLYGFRQADKAGATVIDSFYLIESFYRSIVIMRVNDGRVKFIKLFHECEKLRIQF